MTREEKLQRALKYSDFYELARLTYERSKNMKINIKQVKSKETLLHIGNKLFTNEQVKEIRDV